MGFATLEATTETATTSNSTTIDVAFQQTTGHLVVIYLGISAAETLTLPAGWTELTDSGTAQFVKVVYKVLAGGEGGTVEITLSSAEKAAAIARNYSAFEGTPTLVAADSPQGGTSTAPDPPVVSMTSGDYTVTAFFTQQWGEADDDTWMTAVPSGYGNSAQKTTGTTNFPAANCATGCADIQVTASSENPGTFTISSSSFWQAQTVAILGETASNVTVTPGTLALSDTHFAPEVQTPRTVTPGTLALSDTHFAPEVQTPRVVTPGTLAMSDTEFAPEVQTPTEVTPPTITAVINEQVPVVTVGDSVEVTPPTITAVITEFIPVIEVTADVEVEPPTITAVITEFIPVIEVTADVEVEPPTITAVLDPKIPLILASADVEVEPPTPPITITTFAVTTDITVRVSTFRTTVLTVGHESEIRIESKDPEVSPATAILFAAGAVPAVRTGAADFASAQTLRIRPSWQRGTRFREIPDDPVQARRLRTLERQLPAVEGLPKPAVAGDMLLFNGSRWVLRPKGANGTVLTMVNGLPTWV